jgi:MFS transporter, putative metabolite:H+ symporter
MIFPIGLMAAGQIGALVVPIFGWQIMLLLGGIPGVVIAFLLTRLPESPRWLISKGCIGEAERIIKEVEAKAGTAPVVEFPPATTATAVERSRWMGLLIGSYLNRTLIVWTLWFVSYFITNSRGGVDATSRKYRQTSLRSIS